MTRTAHTHTIALSAVVVLGMGILAGEPDKDRSTTVTVSVQGLSHQQGQILATAFTTRAGFPSDATRAAQSHTVAITNRTPLVVFTNMPPGPCAVGICHDVNTNGQMDAALLGRPQEGYGVSCNPKPRFGPPRFKDAVITLSPGRTNIVIRLVYPKQ